MKVFIIAFAAIFLATPAQAQETGANFAGGSIKIGYDSRSCSGSLGGAVRYDSSADIMEYCNGTDWIAVQTAQAGAPSGAGYFVVGETAYSGCFGLEINTITHSGTTATVDSKWGIMHNIEPGATVILSGNTPAQYNGTFTVTSTTDTTFSYVMGSDPGSDASVLGSYCVSGGLATADALCLHELTANTGWWGHDDALARGLLTAAKVKAWLCDDSTCNNLQPNTDYYFANVFDTGAGGAYLSTDGSGNGPGNTGPQWSLANYFGQVNSYLSKYFTGRAQGTDNLWSGSPSGYSCSNWTSDSTGDAQTGIANSEGYVRWKNWSTAACSTYSAEFSSLICYVNP